MSEIQFFASIIAFLWSSLSMIFSALKQINDKRDLIISGYFNGQPLSVEHRRLILKKDWLPLHISIAWRSIVFVIIIAVIPKFMTPSDNSFWIYFVDYLTLSIPFSTFIAVLVSTKKEYYYILSVLETQEKE